LNYLGGFDFKGDMARSPIENFSGGEKSRLALALLIWTQPNLLLLDEPTNHLDLDMRDALTYALQDYEGGVVLVSHDRALLRASCDQFVLVANGKAEAFEGDLDDYKDWLAAQKTQEKNLIVLDDNGVQKSANQRALDKNERQALQAARRPLIKETEQLEKSMAVWSQEKAGLDLRAGEADLYDANNKLELQNLLKRQAELNDLIETAELRWLELHETLENM
jgi:ATP-binding cassette subfamily F protein 3